MKKKVFALVDCNSFYVSCERIFRPDLVKKPVGVLSNNDGCIVALSKELKTLGVKRGEPEFKVRSLLKKHNVTLFSSNYSLYGDISARVMKVLSQFTHDLEIYSIDEAFLSLEHVENHKLIEYGKKIKDTVWKWIGIPVSVGIAETETLAKLASKIAKKYKAYNGVFSLVDYNDMQKVLSSFELDDIWGIGRRIKKKLNLLGVKTPWELTQKSDSWIDGNFNITLLKTVKELRGISCIDLENDTPPNKEIVSSKSFGRPVSDYQELLQAATTYCARAVEKLRKQKLVASMVMVYVTTNRFKNEPQYANFASAKLPYPSAYTPDFLIPVEKILKHIYRKGYNYKKTGVMISEIIPQSEAPLDLFNPRYDKSEKKILMDTIDKINAKYGSNTIFYLSNGIEKEWKMKREKLSPKYTTSWDELPTVK